MQSFNNACLRQVVISGVAWYQLDLFALYTLCELHAFKHCKLEYTVEREINGFDTQTSTTNTAK